MRAYAKISKGSATVYPAVSAPVEQPSDLPDGWYKASARWQDDSWTVEVGEIVDPIREASELTARTRVAGRRGVAIATQTRIAARFVAVLTEEGS